MSSEENHEGFDAIRREEERLGAELTEVARQERRRSRSSRFLTRARTPLALLAAVIVAVPAGLAVAELASPDDDRAVTGDGTPVPDGPLGIVVLDTKGEQVICPDGEPLRASRGEAVAGLQEANKDGRAALQMPQCADGTVPDDAVELREAYVDPDHEIIPTTDPDE